MKLLLALVFAPLLAWAQAYPTKPIRMVVNFPPGGVNDVTARVIGPPLSKALRSGTITSIRPCPPPTTSSADASSPST